MHQHNATIAADTVPASAVQRQALLGVELAETIHDKLERLERDLVLVLAGDVAQTKSDSSGPSPPKEVPSCPLHETMDEGNVRLQAACARLDALRARLRV